MSPMLTSWFRKSKKSKVIDFENPGQIDIANFLPDVLETIFKYLCLRDKARASQVCHAWRNVINQPSLFRDVEAPLLPGPLILKMSVFPILAKRGITKVSLGTRNPQRCTADRPPCTETDLLILSKGIPLLERLSVGCLAITNDGLSSSVFKAMPYLTHLQLTHTQRLVDATVERIAQNLKNLVMLDMGNCTLLTGASVRYIAGGLPALKYLRFNSSHQLTDAGFLYLSGLDRAANIPNLEVLKLTCCNGLTDMTLLYLSQGQKSLTILELDYCQNFTDTGMAHLVNLPRLRSLSLLNSEGIGDNGLEHVAKMDSLAVFHCFPITDEGLAFLGEGKSKIVALHLSCFHLNFTGEGMRHLSEMPHLRELRLYKCYGVMDRGMEYVAQVASLRELHVKHCPISDNGLALLVPFESKISVLTLDGCASITDVGLGHLTKLASLRRVNIASCPRVTHLVSPTWGQRNWGGSLTWAPAGMCKGVHLLPLY